MNRYDNTSLVGTSLDGAYLTGTNLIGVHLNEARGLTQAQIDEASGNWMTWLPAGLTSPARWLAPERGGVHQPKSPDLP